MSLVGELRGTPIWITDRVRQSFADGSARHAIAASAALETIPTDSETPSPISVAPLFPPKEWFDPPLLNEPTPLVITDEGRIYGHVAIFGICHLGFPDICTLAPHSQSGYTYFHLKEIQCEDGTRIGCGTYTLDTGHSDGRLGWKASIAHYDSTGTAVADFRAGDDEHGIWVAGALRSGLSGETIRKLRGAVPSGDWRGIDGALEMVGVLGVNIPGFPVPRPEAQLVAAADGMRMLSLVAAGIPYEYPVEPVDKATLEKLAALASDEFAELAAEAEA